MSNSIRLWLTRVCHQNGEYSFSTNHEPDLVRKWLDTTSGDDWVDVCDEMEWNEDCDSYEIDCIDIDAVEDADDEDCDYDRQIQRWIDENNVDMNVIFSSGCEIQKITDFIKKNDKLFNTLTKKELVEDLTEDEKKVFYELKEIAGLWIPPRYSLMKDLRT